MGGIFTVPLLCVQFSTKKGSCPPRTQNRVKNQFLEAVTRVIDRHDVSMGQEYPCRRPGAGGGGLAAARADIASKIRIWTYLGSIFAVPLPCAQFTTRKGICPPRTQNRVKNQFFEAATHIIDRHDVSTTQGYPCRPPGTDAGGLPADRTDLHISFKNHVLGEIMIYPRWCATQAPMSQFRTKVTILGENLAQKLT